MQFKTAAKASHELSNVIQRGNEHMLKGKQDMEEPQLFCATLQFKAKDKQQTRITNGTVPILHKRILHSLVGLHEQCDTDFQSLLTKRSDEMINPHVN